MRPSALDSEGGRGSCAPSASLVFLGNSTPDGAGDAGLQRDFASERLLRPQRNMHRFEWPDTSGIEFHVSPGEWIRLLRANGFEIEDLIEIYPHEGASAQPPSVTLEWARAWAVRL